MAFQFRTRENVNPQGKPRVYLCCHPEDMSRCEDIITELLTAHDCAVWYADPTEYRDEEFLAELTRMQLFVIPVTERFLTEPNHARDREFFFAQRNHIPVLPLMQEAGLEGLFNGFCGNLQFLDKYAQDLTALPYAQKLRKFLTQTLLDDETLRRIHGAFSARIFLSYRKKDRAHARKLIKLLHADPRFRDVAIWYDEFLTPGENFNVSIQTAFDESDLFVMAVTPSLLEPSPDARGKMQDNYIVRIEYPMAQASGKPIVPVEMVPTDRNSLEAKYKGIPHCTDHRDAAALSQALAKHLAHLCPERSAQSPAHDYLIGLAYLRGIETEADHEKALPLIQNAALQGMPEAVEMLVTMYAEGMGVARSLDMTAKWQARLIELRQAKFDSAPSQETGLALLEEIDALMHLHEDTGDTRAFLNLTQRLRDTAASVMEVVPCAEAFRYISVAMTTLGQYYFQAEDYASALLCCQQSCDILRQALRSRGIAPAYGVPLSPVHDSFTMILLRDYCTALCSEADALASQAREEDDSGKLAQAHDRFRLVYHCLTDPVMKDSYPGYNEQLSAACSRMGDIEAAYSRFDQARKWYQQALDLDVARVKHARQNHDFEAFDACARGMYAYATANPQDPDVTVLYAAMKIWQNLAFLVPEIPEYEARASDLEPYVHECARIAIRRYNQSPDGQTFPRSSNFYQMEYFMNLSSRHPHPGSEAARAIYSLARKKREIMRQEEEAGQTPPPAPEKKPEPQKQPETPKPQAPPEKSEEQLAFEKNLYDAQHGDGQACLKVSKQYAQGKGTQKDLNAAVSWAKQALLYNQEQAYGVLADLYYDTKDYASALAYAKKGAKHGQFLACATLRSMYRLGRGVRKNKLLTSYWNFRVRLSLRPKRK